MSYDIWLEIDTGGPEPAIVHEVGNYTSNVVPMWAKALGGTSLGEYHGRNAGDAVTELRAAVARMDAEPAIYAAMNPPNGWGESRSARDYLNKVAQACADHPRTTIHISR